MNSRYYGNKKALMRHSISQTHIAYKNDLVPIYINQLFVALYYYTMEYIRSTHIM